MNNDSNYLKVIEGNFSPKTESKANGHVTSSINDLIKSAVKPKEQVYAN
jgi:hypothetical protein